MVLDTSAIVAIVFDEPERDIFVRLLATEPVLAISVVSLYEASIVVAGAKKNRRAVELVDNLVRDLTIEVAPVDLEGAMAARAAYLRFGRGWHEAKLNLADCFAYGLAKLRNEPLLFKGNDFLQTDIVPAWRPTDL